ncbi:MAG TPA: MBL fold metallo-hydrolase [Gammaproteobacteria bacterium]|nr:MBL fold metallo-hydrolase [Gammaproteobacteria bacterium]
MPEFCSSSQPTGQYVSLQRHSFCFLIEHDSKELLFDPGKFSFVERRIKLDVFGGVSTAVITHSHPDHIAVEILKRFLALSGASVIGMPKPRPECKKKASG